MIGLAGPDYDAPISFGLPFESEDCRYGKSRLNLLIIDELGFVPLSHTGAELLFEVVSQRYERGSILVTTNLQRHVPGKRTDWSRVRLFKKLINGVPRSNSRISGWNY